MTDNSREGVAPAAHMQTDAAHFILTIYVSQHCANCRYARELAHLIPMRYPHVQVRVVDLESAAESIPEQVFATPTYLLNGQIWSLGNPSPEKVQTMFACGQHT